MLQDGSTFDDCYSNNVKVYLNSEFYSYDDLNLDFSKKKYIVLFDCTRVFVKHLYIFYGINCFETLLNMLSFIKKESFAIIDCSR